MLFVTSARRDAVSAYRLLRERLSSGATVEMRTLAWPGPGDPIEDAPLWCQPNGRLWAYLAKDPIDKRCHCWFGASLTPGRVQTPTIEINFDEKQEQRYLTGRLLADESGNFYLAHKGELKGGRRSVVTAGRFENSIKGFSKHDVTWSDGRLERLFVIGAIDNPSFVSRLSSFVNEARRLKQLAIDGQLPRAVNPNASFTAGSSGKSKGHRSSEYEVDRWHHLIVKSLHDELNHGGLKTFSSKHQDMMPDLYSLSDDKKLHHLFEIKTSQETSSLYTAIGQLIVYGADQATTPKRVLVVENPIDDQNFKRALAKQRILVLNFERVGKSAFKFPNLKRTLKLLDT
jgi:hypothetical protein